jgi:hypothetical protein
MKLFEDDWGVDNSTQDDTQITTTILYFSEKELATFKKLLKIGMRQEYGEKVFSDANISDLLLLILKNRYEKN